MSMFSPRKKKQEEIAKVCFSYCNCNESKGEKNMSLTYGEKVKSVKVLGAGCASCHKQYVNVTEAVKNLGLSIEVEYITDFAKLVEYGVMSMPALVVNEKIVSIGKVLKVCEVEKVLKPE